MYRDIIILLGIAIVRFTRGQWLNSVQVEPVPPVRAGDTATFTCSFTGNNVTVQYITWTKISKEGRRVFVYEYSEHPPIRQAYHDFTGRTSVDSFQDNREGSRVTLPILLSKGKYNGKHIYNEDINYRNKGDISLSNAWKLPQNDFVGPVGKGYADSHQTKITLNQKDNFLISDEVRKDIQHHLPDDNDKTKGRNYLRNYNRYDVSQQSMTKKYTFSKKGNEHSNSGSRPSIQKHKPNTPVLKLDVITESPENITTIPVLGGNTLAVTVAGNHGQIPIDDISVRIYENPIEMRGQQYNKRIRSSFERGEQYEQRAENEHQNAFRNVDRNHQSYGIYNKLDPRSKARESNMGYKKIETISKDAMEIIGNPIQSKTPFQDSKQNSKIQTPIHGSNVSLSKKYNREKDIVGVRSRYRPRSTFRHKYFSRYTTPDLRFKRDLSRILQQPGDTGHMTLHLHHVSLEDEAMYECQVKPLGGPARWGRTKLNIHVAPAWPIIDAPVGPYQENQNGTLECKGNVGKPAGTLRWYRKRSEQDIFIPLSDLLIETKAYSLANGSAVAVSKLNLAFTEYDDGSVYRCVATSSIMAAHEEKPQAEITLSVQFAPREGRILFDTALGRYYCHARGNPSPTYAWLWMRPDGGQTIISSDRYLDLKGMRRSGYYRFHCLASNVIHGVRHTKVMVTKLRVIAPETTTSSTTTTTLPTTTTTPTTTPPPTTTTTEIPTPTHRDRPFDDPDTKYDQGGTTSFKSSSRPHGYISRLDIMRKQQERQMLDKQRKDIEEDNNHINDEDYFYDDEDEYDDEDDDDLKIKSKNDGLEGMDHLDTQIT